MQFGARNKNKHPRKRNKHAIDSFCFKIELRERNFSLKKLIYANHKHISIFSYMLILTELIFRINTSKDFFKKKVYLYLKIKSKKSKKPKCYLKFKSV